MGEAWVWFSEKSIGGELQVTDKGAANVQVCGRNQQSGFHFFCKQFCFADIIL